MASSTRGADRMRSRTRAKLMNFGIVKVTRVYKENFESDARRAQNTGTGHRRSCQTTSNSRPNDARLVFA